MSHQRGAKSSDLLTVTEAADLMTSLGYKTSASTLKLWRRRWISGVERKGPTPLLIHPRCLRYERADVEASTKALLIAARRAAEGR